MPNIIDYIKWRGDLSFEDSPFNEIDALVFSEIVYVHFDDLVPFSVVSRGVPMSTLADKFFSLKYDRNKLGAILPTNAIFELFKIASESRRYADVLVKGYVNEIDIKAQKQFCALTFDIGEDELVVAFRGTDDTIIGWKEDLNMAFFTPIPSQKQGMEYLNSAIHRTQKQSVYVCGHSKGGNLATYATLMVDEESKKHIKASYNFDGPGFKADVAKRFFGDPILERMYKIIPTGAVIGTIFESVENCKFVKSTAKGMYQHDAFSWELLGTEFVCEQSVVKSSQEWHDLLNKWVDNLTIQEQKDFAEALYTVLTVNDSTTLTDIANDKFKFLFGVLKTDDKTKKTFLSNIYGLIKEKYFKKGNKKDNEAKK